MTELTELTESLREHGTSDRPGPADRREEGNRRGAGPGGQTRLRGACHLQAYSHGVEVWLALPDLRPEAPIQPAGGSVQAGRQTPERLTRGEIGRKLLRLLEEYYRIREYPSSSIADIYHEVIMEQIRNQFIEFQCPHCHVRVQADREKRGKKGFCPRCNYIIRIPKD